MVQLLPVGSEPGSVAIGDLSGDGVPDLIVANSRGGTVSLLRGNGDGTFQPRVNLPSGPNPASVAVGDLNGDGHLDLAVANLSVPGSISLLLGNGDGTFQPRQSVPTPTLYGQVIIGDFNGDSVPDILASAAGPYLVLLGNGDGTFQSLPQASLFPIAGEFAIADLDGDGVLDLASYSATLSLFLVSLGNGDGTFRATEQYRSGTTPISVAVGDLNADGIPDLAASQSSDRTIGVRFGNGDGTFGPRQDFATPFFGNITIADPDGDGVPDIVIADAFADSLVVLRGNGDGTFQPGREFAVGTDPASVVLDDLDGNGRLDAVVLNFDSNFVTVLLNQCTPITPQIVEQPRGVLVGPTPEPVSFSVVATSPLPMTYRWLRDGVPLDDDAQITGSRTATLTIFADASDVARYRCVVMSPNGQTLSDAAVLGFRANPCPADFNTDGLLNFFDIITYINTFNAGCP